MEPGASIDFELTGKQGATLITKYPTYREDIERDRRFGDYIKQYYESWVDFAQEQGYPEDVRPILVTGVDLTRDFATAAYSDNRTPMECEFLATLPAVASNSADVWGSWHPQGFVHTNCGPDLAHQGLGLNEGFAPGSKIPDEYTRCVFIRYYTIRKRLFEGGLQILSVDDSTEVDAFDEVIHNVPTVGLKQ